MLIELCIEINIEFDKLYDLAVTLTPYSTLFRYPGEIIEPDREDVYEAINKAERIYNFVKERINGLNRDKLIEDKENTEWK